MHLHEARRKVLIPSWIMRAYGLLLVAAGGAIPLILVVDQPEEMPAPFAVALIGLTTAIALLCGVAMVLGGWRMAQLRSYRFVLTSIVVALVAGVLFCLPATILPIWPLIAVLDTNVRLCFDKQPDEFVEG